MPHTSRGRSRRRRRFWAALDRARRWWRRRRPRRPVVLIGGTCAVLVVAGLLTTLALSCSGCFGRPAAPPVADHPPSPPVELGQEPQLRIRIARGRGELTVDGQRGGAVLVQPHPDRSAHSPLRFDGGADIQRRQGAFIIQPTGGGQAFRWRLDALDVHSREDALGLDGAGFPGRLVLVATGEETFDVVNHVGIETYLPGVLASELYSHWHIEAYRAQAIAARSYALVMAERRRRLHYDLENTQASQVYAGATANARALEAARDTRGLVLSYDGLIVPAYYSSCTGPLGQDAALVFSNERDIPPLRGRDHRPWSDDSPHRLWGPVQRPIEGFSRRIAAWGRSVGHAVAAMDTLEQVEVIRRSHAGRAAAFRLTDRRGRSYELHAEQLRLAANHADASLPSLSAAQRLRSGDVEVRLEGPFVRIRGRGFGHGVGMSQHGAQSMARQGQGYQQILNQYYPQARIVRAY